VSGSSSSAPQRLWNGIRGSLWPIPMIGVVIAIALGIGMPAIDGLLEKAEGGSPLTFAFGGGPSAARDVLAAIAGSLISVTGLTFSLTVVALQLSSSQYSPRLLQTFVKDRVVQVTLAQLVATFVYALTVLRTVRTENASNSDIAFVPRLSITVGYLFTLGAVIALVLFLAHLTEVLRVETMLRDVHDEASDIMDDELDERGSEESFSLPQTRARPLPAGKGGFVVGVDHGRLVKAARSLDAVVLIEPRIGDTVVPGTPIAHVWAPASADLDALQKAIDKGVYLAFERSGATDIAYGLRKVVDIAVRALSPGTNDPTTAVHAMSHVSALIGDLSHRSLAANGVYDDDGKLRLAVPQWDLSSLVQLAVEEPIVFAEGQPAVLRRIAMLLRELAWRAPAGSVDDEVRYWIDRVRAVAEGSTEMSGEETGTWRPLVEDALDGLWPARSHP